jgi:TrmH family RNA methyltransferase
MSRMQIISLQNPRIKAAAELHERKARRDTGHMLIEGYHELQLAWSSAVSLVTLFIVPAMLRDGEEKLLLDIDHRGVEIIEVPRQVLEKMAYRENPDAWLAVARIPKHGLDSLVLPDHPFIIIAENLEKPGNLGAILRSADAVGASAVLVCEGRTDVFNPNVVRASKGALFSMPVVECGNREALTWLHAHGISILAATPEGADRHWDADLTGAVAVAVGAEKEGLSEFWLSRADSRVVIPMQGRVNSLNVAQAATILGYEAWRQRQEAGVSQGAKRSVHAKV